MCTVGALYVKNELMENYPIFITVYLLSLHLSLSDESILFEAYPPIKLGE
jgi:hypothetical protein